MILKPNCFYYILFLTILSCGSVKPFEDVNDEFARIKFLDNNHFKYFFYKSTIDSITHYYCRGHYIKLSNSKYQLFPDSINPNKFDVQYDQNMTDSAGNGTVIKISTDIIDAPTDLAKYRITIINDSFNLVVHGTILDTIISVNKLNAFKIKVSLREDYTKLSPLPTFNSVTTDYIHLADKSNSVVIKIPVSLETFYYKYKKLIDLEDNGEYWVIDDKKIKKNTNFPFN